MTTTSDARKRLAENAATPRPASSPAPAAVPPGTAMSPMDVRDHRPEPVADADAALARRVHQVVGYVPAGFGDVLRLLRHPDVEDATRAALFPHPEPVVSPLPSEAVEAGAQALTDHHGGPDASTPTAHHHDARLVLTAALPHLRLVPEDDEDTVRAAGKCNAAEVDVTKPADQCDEDTVRERIAAALTEQATMRFDKHGPHDDRGAAFWDAAQGIREMGLGR